MIATIITTFVVLTIVWIFIAATWRLIKNKSIPTKLPTVGFD